MLWKVSFSVSVISLRTHVEYYFIKRIVIADELLTEVTKLRNELARIYRLMIYFSKCLMTLYLIVALFASIISNIAPL